MDANEFTPTITDSAVETARPQPAPRIDTFIDYAAAQLLLLPNIDAVKSYMQTVSTKLPESAASLRFDGNDVSVALERLNQVAQHQRSILELLNNVSHIPEAKSEHAFDTLTSDAQAVLTEGMDKIDSATSVPEAIEEFLKVEKALASSDSYANGVTTPEKAAAIKSFYYITRASILSTQEARISRNLGINTPEYQSEIMKSKVESRHYLEHCAGIHESFSFVNVAILNLSETLRPNWTEDLAHWFEIRKRIDKRLNTESGKYRWSFRYKDMEEVQSRQPDHLIAGLVHAHLEHHLRYLNIQTKNGTLTGEAAVEAQQAKITILLDEDHRADLSFDLSQVKDISDEDELRAALHLMVMRTLSSKTAFRKMILDDRTRADLHEFAYSGKRKDRPLYKEFYKHNPNYIINFHRDDNSNAQFIDRTEASSWSPFDPYSIGITADADWALSFNRESADLHFKMNHRWNGMPAAPWVIDVADSARNLFDYYQKSPLRIAELPRRELKGNPWYHEKAVPIQEAVATASIDTPIPRVVFTIGEEKHRLSESVVLANAIATMNDVRDYQLLVNASEAPWKPTDVREDNLMSAIVTTDPFLFMHYEPEEFARYIKELSGELKRTKKGLATTALYTAPLGEKVEPKIAGSARTFQRAINLLAASHGQISVAPTFIFDEETRSKLHNLEVIGFDSARPMNQTHVEYATMTPKRDSFGIIGVTDDPESKEVKLRVRLEPCDVPSLWISMIDAIRSKKGSIVPYAKTLDPLIRKWQEYSMGNTTLEEYEKAAKEAYKGLRKLGIKDSVDFGETYDLVETASERAYRLSNSKGKKKVEEDMSYNKLTRLMNDLLIARAHSMISPQRLSQSIELFVEEAEDYGGEIQYKDRP